MDTALTQSEIAELIEEIIKTEGIINPKTEATNGYKIGDGFMSYLTMVKVTGENKTLDLAVKSAPRKSGDYRKIMSTRNSFLREMHFFATIVPLFKTLADINYLPMCYKTVDAENKELLVFENLKTLGFELTDCKVPMDHSHVVKVLQTYAKFHASSLALKHHNPEGFRRVTRGMDVVFGAAIMEDFNKFVRKNISNIISILHEDTALCNALEGFKNNLSDFCELLAKSKDERGVVIHGDCWCNNIMFKYEQLETSKTLKAVKLIDFQLTTLANPIVDIANFIFLSCDVKTLTNLDEFLFNYYDALCVALRDMNCKPEDIYPEQMFYSDWKLYGKFGLLMGCTEFYVMMREDDEKVCIDNLDEKMLSSLMEGNIRNKAEADRRLCELAKYMYENGLIN